MYPELKLEALPKRVKGSYLKNRATDTKIVTNYFPVRIKSFQNLYIFKVAFEPKIMNDNRSLREKLLNEALPSIRQQINNPVMGGMNIYSVVEPIAGEGQHKAGQHTITVKQVKCISVQDNPRMLLHFLNNGIRNIMMTLDYIEIGQTGKYFNKQGKKNVFADLSIYPGYKVNFLMAQAGMFLRVDPTSKLVQNKSALDSINDIYRVNGDRDRDEKRQLVKESLVGKVVMTNYGKTKYARIQDVEFVSLKETMIPGLENLNILDYYQQKYNIVAKPNQPLLRVENKNKKDTNAILMLPELCLMTGLPADFDQHRRKKVSQETIVSADQKFNNIKRFIKQIKETAEEKSLADLGIKIEERPQEMLAKTLPSPTIHLGKGARVEPGKEAGFNLFAQPIFDPKHKVRMALIYFERAEITELIDTFNDTSKRLQIDLKIAKFKISPSSSRPSLNELKDDILVAVKDAIKQECNSCLILIRGDMRGYYKDIKRYCLEQKNIVTQVVVETTLRKKNARSIHTKILLQTAAKAGNTLWVPSAPSQITGKTMLMSFDISKAGGARKLIGIATSNDTLTKFISESTDLEDTLDKFQKMVKIMINLVQKYIKRNSKVPKEVILLTNSCPRNQVKLLYDYFIPHVTEQLRKIGGTASEIRLTIVQTKDQSSQRFFTLYSDGSANNPNSGLLVSDTIVSQNYDFYLISQKPRAGCTVPIHFNIINSNSQLEEGLIQELMYSQCFNYANWTGSIKIPAIMQYAKKFARFCSEVLKGNIRDEGLSSKLYFI